MKKNKKQVKTHNACKRRVKNKQWQMPLVIPVDEIQVIVGDNKKQLNYKGRANFISYPCFYISLKPYILKQK